GGGGGGGGAGLRPRTIEGETESLRVQAEVGVIRGTSTTFTASVKNIFLNSTLHNVSLKASGLLSQFVFIEPGLISLIEFNRTGIFNLTISIPPYLDTGERGLNITANGTILTPRGPTEVVNGLSETALVRIAIQAVTPEGAERLFSESQAIAASMVRDGLPTGSVDKLLREIRNALAQGDFERVAELARRMREASETARSTRALLEGVSIRLAESSENGIDTPQSSRLFTLASLAFERSDFATAHERVRNAELVYLLETQGKINIGVFLIRNWIIISISIISGSLAAYLSYVSMRKKLITRQLRTLAREEMSVNSLVKEAQKACFEDKKISVGEYYKAMSRYQARLEQIRNKSIELRSKRISLLHAFDELADLKEEYSKLVALMKDLQAQYFEQGSTDWNTYTQKINALNERRAEVEKQLALVEAKSELERRR
ncbi:MAG: hypothetical protein HY367_00825, partial [Candidatus Aenigmarchaeota archaeon]|nr:hypothetical protein [Candidatus Aenigmarchaeota archaeon]